MENFNYSIPTEIFFGRGQIRVLGREILKYGNKVLLVYGGGSIKKNGVYDDVIRELKEFEIPYVELSGVEPNPKLESVIKGREICRQENVDFILGIGGGSSIDCAKAIGASYYYEGNPWDLVMDNSKIERSLPIGGILTISATGSEMNKTAVISNQEENQKYSMNHPDMNPKFSILDPEYTYTVSKYQTASGTADIMSHTLENYFSMVDSAYLQDRLAEAVLKTCIKYGPVAIDQPKNYEARANLMWASSLAINGLLDYGKNTAWSVHTLQHELTAYYDDLPHGIGLAILTPNWMNQVLDKDNMYKFVEYGKNVWNIDGKLKDEEIAKLSIERTREFFESLGISMRLSDYGIGDEYFEEMTEAGLKFRGGSVGSFKPLYFDDIMSIYNMSL